jgi:type II secretory pathway pseudopilin PulG
MSARERRDDGLTLIELVISMGLGVLVLVILSSFFISSFQAQTTVTNTAEATGDAQLAARQLDDDLSSASAVRVVDGATTDSQLLIARTSQGTGTAYVCHAWLYDADADAILHREFAGATGAPWASNAVAWVDASVTGAGWKPLAQEIAPEGAADGSPASAIFTASGDRGASVSFEVSAGDDRLPVLISTTATGRQAFKNAEPACF